MTPEKLYKETEFSELTGVPVHTLRTWRKRNEGPAVKKLGRGVWYAASDWQKYLESQTHDPQVERRRRRR